MNPNIQMQYELPRIIPSPATIALGIEEIDGLNIDVDMLKPSIVLNPGFYDQFEIDISTIDMFSTKPAIKVKNETLMLKMEFADKSTQKYELGMVFSEDISDEDIMIAMLDNDFIVKMPPKKEYKIRVKVISIEKASPRVVEPE